MCERLIRVELPNDWSIHLPIIDPLKNLIACILKNKAMLIVDKIRKGLLMKNNYKNMPYWDGFWIEPSWGMSSTSL